MSWLQNQQLTIVCVGFALWTEDSGVSPEDPNSRETQGLGPGYQGRVPDVRSKAPRGGDAGYLSRGMQARCC